MGFLSRLRRARSRDPRFDRRPTRVRPLPGASVEVQIMGTNSLDILHARDISVRGVGVLVPHLFEGCDIDSRVELVVTLPGAADTGPGFVSVCVPASLCPPSVPVD